MNNGTFYLEFVELDDYIHHLQETIGMFNPIKAEHPDTRIEITSTSGESDERGICSISYQAVLTRRFEDHIAVCAIPLLQTTNFHLQVEKDALRAKHENFDKVYAMLGERGLTIERGVSPQGISIDFGKKLRWILYNRKRREEKMRWRLLQPKTVRCAYVAPNGIRCNKMTMYPPYCWTHTELGRPDKPSEFTQCQAKRKDGKRCIRGTGGHPSGLCPAHRS